MIHAKRKPSATEEAFASSSAVLRLLAQDVSPTILHDLLASGSLLLDPCEVSPVTGDNALGAVLGCRQSTVSRFFYLSADVRRGDGGAWGNEEAGADPDSPVARAMAKRLALKPLLTFLLEAGCDPFLENRDGLAPVDSLLACDQPDAIDWILKNLSGAIDRLRARPASLPARLTKALAAGGGTAPERLPCLHTAALTGNPVMLDILLKAGWPVNDLDENGNTPLHMARHADVARQLLDAGADTDLQNQQGLTPAGQWQVWRSINAIATQDLKRMVAWLPSGPPARLLDSELAAAVVAGTAASFDAIWSRCGRDPNRVLETGDGKMSLMELACLTALSPSTLPRFVKNSAAGSSRAHPLSYIVPRLLSRGANLARQNAAGVSDECWLFLASLWTCGRYMKGTWSRKAGGNPFFWCSGEAMIDVLCRVTPQLHILGQQAQDGLVETHLYSTCVSKLATAMGGTVAQAGGRTAFDEVFCALGKIAAYKGAAVGSSGTAWDWGFQELHKVRADSTGSLTVGGHNASTRWLEACIWWLSAIQFNDAGKPWPVQAGGWPAANAAGRAVSEKMADAAMQVVCDLAAGPALTAFMPALRRLAAGRQPRAESTINEKYIQTARALVSANDLRVASAAEPAATPGRRANMAGM